MRGVPDVDARAVSGLANSATRRPELVPVVATTFVVAMTGVAATLYGTGVLTGPVAAGMAQFMICSLAGLGATYAWRRSRDSRGVEHRVWRLMAFGLLSWTLGIIPYLTFLVVDGDLRSPSAYSQIGFLLAYPFWYRALWLVRRPVIGSSVRARVETWLLEFGVFVMLGAAAAGLVWHDELPASQNVAQLVPLALDLLLLHSVYSAARRSTVTHSAAFVWFAYGFSALAITDGLVSWLVTHAPLGVIAAVMVGYSIALCFFTIATTRPLRITEARAGLGATAPLLAAFGLALCGVASAVMPAPVRPFIWTIALLLFARLWMLLRERGRSETDPLTGFLEPQPFSRHLAGVTQLAGPDRLAVLVAVELDQFGRWLAQHGVGEADTLLNGIAARLEAATSGGVWARLGEERFAWVGGTLGAADARALAESIRAAADDNAPGIVSRASFVVIPDDAPAADTALAAAEEGLAAAQTARRRVVAFDRGRLDGIEYTSGYTASLARRRRAIAEILQEPDSVRIFLQPIVSLTDGSTVGYEALSRFPQTPERPPDRWVAEAHAVGLGLELEAMCVRRAVVLRGQLPDGVYLSVNMSPDAVLTPAMEAAVGAGPLDGLVIEITEHDAVSDYARLAARLADYRARGARVAIDDAGAGHASMRHVAQLAPDYIKVDRSLIHDLHVDHAKRALVRSMVTLEPELGATIIAEGIERAEELRALRALGVPFGQGYLLGRPAATATETALADAWVALTAEPA